MCERAGPLANPPARLPVRGPGNLGEPAPNVSLSEPVAGAVARLKVAQTLRYEWGGGSGRQPGCKAWYGVDRLLSRYGRSDGGQGLKTTEVQALRGFKSLSSDFFRPNVSYFRPTDVACA